MTHLDLTEAIEAAAITHAAIQREKWNLRDSLWAELSEETKEDIRQYVLPRVEAAAPLIERQVRERIAADIEAAAARYVHGDRFTEVAARIARAGAQP
jgi:hypothetical protein